MRRPCEYTTHTGGYTTHTGGYTTHTGGTPHTLEVHHTHWMYTTHTGCTPHTHGGTPHTLEVHHTHWRVHHTHMEVHHTHWRYITHTGGTPHTLEVHHTHWRYTTHYTLRNINNIKQLMGKTSQCEILYCVVANRIEYEAPRTPHQQHSWAMYWLDIPLVDHMDTCVGCFLTSPMGCSHSTTKSTVQHNSIGS